MVKVSYRKLSYYIWNLRYYRAGPLEPGGHKFTGPLVLNYNKKVSFSWLETYFHEGNATERVHLRTSSPPDHGVGNVKEVSKPYLHTVYFFSSLWPLSSFKWFGGLPVGVYNSFPLTTKHVKRSLTKSLTRIFHFQLAALALKNHHIVIHDVIQISWKIPLNELNELILSLKTSLSLNHTKKYTPVEILWRILVQNLRAYLCICFRKIFI